MQSALSTWQDELTCGTTSSKESSQRSVRNTRASCGNLSPHYRSLLPYLLRIKESGSSSKPFDLGNCWDVLVSDRYGKAQTLPLEHVCWSNAYDLVNGIASFTLECRQGQRKTKNNLAETRPVLARHGWSSGRGGQIDSLPGIAIPPQQMYMLVRPHIVDVLVARNRVGIREKGAARCRCRRSRNAREAARVPSTRCRTAGVVPELPHVPVGAQVHKHIAAIGPDKRRSRDRIGSVGRGGQIDGLPGIAIPPQQMNMLIRPHIVDILVAGNRVGIGEKGAPWSRK